MHLIEPKGSLATPVSIEEAIENCSDLRRSAISRVLIIVPDNTRGIPFRAAVTALLKKIGTNRVQVLIATGLHDPCTAEDIDLTDLPVPVTCHNARDKASLVTVDYSTSVNKLAATADLIICVGVVKPHHFAGFSGGLKAILPGVAGADFVQCNHSMRDDPNAHFGCTEYNPIRMDIVSVSNRFIPARKLCLNFVEDKLGQQHWWAGPAETVFLKQNLGEPALQCYATEAQRFKTLIVRGLDVEQQNLYQATRWLAHAGPFLQDGGTLVLQAHCVQGLGCKPSFLSANNFRFGIGRYLPLTMNILLDSSIPHKLQGLYCKPYLDHDNGEYRFLQTHGAAVIQNASYILPQGWENR